jgi:hypothetical protein
MKDFIGLSENIKEWNNDKIKELEEKQNKIYNQEQKLKVEGHKISEEIVQLKLEHLKPVLGMCFAEVRNGYVMIYKLPEYQYDSYFHRLDPNFYQLPVYRLDFSDDEVAIYTDTIYSRAVEASDPRACLAEEYDLISQEEFMDKATQICKHISKFFIDND